MLWGASSKAQGGTIVTGGGYVAGRADLIEAVGARLTAPGVGLDAGCVDGQTQRLVFQGMCQELTPATSVLLVMMRACHLVFCLLNLPTQHLLDIVLAGCCTPTLGHDADCKHRALDGKGRSRLLRLPSLENRSCRQLVDARSLCFAALLLTMYLQMGMACL